MGLEALRAIGPLAGALGGPVLANLFAPEGQELSSFEGRGAVDPVTMLSNVNTLIGRIGKGVSDRAASPVSLPSSYVQNVPTFTGGGLPMPIGVSGQDPALANPSLLNLQGMGEFQNLFNDLQGAPYDPNNPKPNPVDRDDGYRRDPYTPPGDRIAVPKAHAEMPSSSVTRRREPASLVRGADLMADGPNDIDRAEAAIRLLMDNL